ncbi:MAG: alpha/beta hydrolase [Spirochaetes bacterium]|nr:alpha/beta hydrolase [Spirochaetota bacterium]
MKTNLRMLNVNGINLETVRYGPPPEEAATLIFLHEGLGCVEMWHDFPEKAAEAAGCAALVYSRQGYGRSDSCTLPLPLSFMHHEGLNVLPALISAAGIKEYMLIGHSDGASISLIFAGGTPAVNLKGIILEAPHTFCEKKTVSHIREAKDWYENGDLKKRLEKYHGINTECAFYGWNRAWLDPDFKKWNIEEYLPDIKVPAFVIQGADDEYGTLKHMQSIELKSSGVVKTLVLDKCGHSPHKDQQKKVLQSIAAFVKEINNTI